MEKSLRSFKVRHSKPIFFNNNIYSKYANYLNINHHNFDTNYDILQTESKAQKLNFWDALEINKYKNSDKLYNDQFFYNNLFLDASFYLPLMK